MLAVFLVLLPLAASVSATHCPKLEGKLDFEPQRFAGHWYYAAYNINPNRPWEMECAEFNVTVAEVENTGIFKLAYVFNYLSNGRKTLVTMNTETISADQPGLFYSAGKRVNSNFWSDVHEAAIIATDYENYAAAVLCAPQYNPETNKFSANLWGYLWSRSRVLKDDSYEVLKNLLLDHGVREKDLVDTRNSVNCEG